MKKVPVVAALVAVVGAFAIGLVVSSFREGPEAVRHPGQVQPVATNPNKRPTSGPKNGNDPNGTSASPQDPKNNDTVGPVGPTAPNDPKANKNPADNGSRVLPPFKPESLGSGREGEGEVVDFYQKFKDPKDREAWEEQRRKRWEDRLKAENEAAIKLMTEKLGISKAQQDSVRKILDEQMTARNDLIAKMKKGDVARTDFQEQVLKIKNAAHAQLKATLTADQYAGYLALDPREQVLNDETKNPK